MSTPACATFSAGGDDNRKRLAYDMYVGISLRSIKLTGGSATKNMWLAGQDTRMNKAQNSKVEVELRMLQSHGSSKNTPSPPNLGALSDSEGYMRYISCT